MNYPWAGRLGRIVDRCIYCGNAGPAFDLSSRSHRCLASACERENDEPIPQELDRLRAATEAAARAWCAANDWDYDAVMREGEPAE